MNPDTDLFTLRRHGIGLAIDDFGVGYASLRYLAELPITCIKVDRSFTARLPADPTSMTLVRAVVGLAEQLAINCIIEGVESEDQVRNLPSYQRLLVQGYLFGKPRPATSGLTVDGRDPEEHGDDLRAVHTAGGGGETVQAGRPASSARNEQVRQCQPGG